MRISDWSSDVCSSDLERLLHIKASPRGSLSRSAMVASRLLARLQETDVEPLDLFDADLPPFGGAVIEGRYALLSGQPVAEDAAADWQRLRSEGRRVGKECVSPCRYRWTPYYTQKK